MLLPLRHGRACPGHPSWHHTAAAGRHKACPRAGLRPNPGAGHDDEVRPAALHSESLMPTAGPSMTNGSTPLLVARDIIAGYGRGDEILKGVHLTVDESEIVAIIGPNGAGKSTLLKTIAG